jgi:hypothetical protein
VVGGEKLIPRKIRQVNLEAVPPFSSPFFGVKFLYDYGFCSFLVQWHDIKKYGAIIEH